MLFKEGQIKPFAVGKYVQYGKILKVNLDDRSYLMKEIKTKKQYTVKNIITYQVPTKNIDSYGRKAISNIGGGSGYYITNGYAIPITWEKNSRSSKTIYRYVNGEELVVNDGNTFIQIQPSSEQLLIK